MQPMFSRTETWLAAGVAALIAAALLGPFVAQPADYHAFADRRTIWGVPFAQDTLSNLAFLGLGMLGLRILRAHQDAGAGASAVEQGMVWLFFAGLVCTAIASSWYHLAPDDAGLLVDRCGMAVAFAGLLGLACAGRVSARAGIALAVGVLLLAPASAAYWLATGNLLPWAVLQAGGMVAILAFAWLRPRAGALRVRWGWVIALYAIAKLLELQDHAVHALTGQLASGHTLKHIAAALAAVPVIAALQVGRQEQPA